MGAFINFIFHSSPNSSGGTKSDQHFNFDFDRVFGHQSTQEEVFDEVSQLVQSAIDGYNVCIFAYGQTGSGKTYTMEGDEHMEKLGIIPKTITKIFEETHGLVEKGWSYKLEASFLEIYNEEIRDLLATEKGLKYDIKKVDTKSNEIYVTNLKIEDVTSGENINGLLKRAKKNRALQQPIAMKDRPVPIRFLCSKSQAKILSLVNPVQVPSTW